MLPVNPYGTGIGGKRIIGEMGTKSLRLVDFDTTRNIISYLQSKEKIHWHSTARNARHKRMY